MAWCRLGLAAAVMAAVLLPWLVWVAVTNGLGATRGGAQRFEPVIGVIRLLNLRFSGAPFMDVVGIAGAWAWSSASRVASCDSSILLGTTYLIGAGAASSSRPCHGRYWPVLAWPRDASIGSSLTYAGPVAPTSDRALAAWHSSWRSSDRWITGRPLVEAA